MVLPLDPHVLGLDGDAPLALEVHRVEVLLLHVARLDRARDLEDAIGQRRLAVIDVGDDREVADARQVHGGPHAIARQNEIGRSPGTSWRYSPVSRKARSFVTVLRA